jgi:hypothetical protein
MIFEVLGGLIMRLWNIASICDVMDGHTHRIKLVWKSVIGINCNLEDIFSEGLVVNDFFRHDNRTVLLFGSEQEALKESGSSNLVYTIDDIKMIGHEHFDYFKLYNDNYIISDYSLWDAKTPTDENYAYFCNFMKTLVPTEEVLDIVNKYGSQIDDDTYGINIRGCSGTINESKLAAPFNVSKAIPMMQKMVKDNKDIKFLITTGSYSIIKELRKYFNDRMIYIRESRYPLDTGNSPNGVKRALMDWYLLSKVKWATIPVSGYAIKACEYGKVSYKVIKR